MEVNNTSTLLVIKINYFSFVNEIIILMIIQVLKHYRFIDDNRAIQLKGRVACEIHTHEMMVTELLFSNSLAGFDPPEIAAILSCMVFQQVSS